VTEQRKLVLASHNTGKLRELAECLRGLRVSLVTIADELGRPFVVDETGTSFEANARLKARAARDACGSMCLADDSGLEVDALQGRPGVHSARYAGAGASDARNVEKLLREIEGVPSAERTARYRCVVVVSSPDLDAGELIIRASCEGRIATAPRGARGFGYDPVFELDDGRTMAELELHEKQQISHRGRALSALRPRLRAWLR
jgi:XTP/dITP diphosphohydrolase